MNQELKRRCDQSLIQAYEQVTDIFIKLYPQTEEVETKKNDQFHLHLEEMLAIMASDLERKLEKLQGQVEEMQEEIRTTQKELGLEENVPVYEASLSEQVKMLKTFFKDLEELKGVRLAKINDLYDEMVKIAAQLGVEPLARPPNLTTQEVDKFEERVSAYRKEQEKRRSQFKQLVSEIETLFKRLAHQPSTDYEIELMTSSEEEYSLSRESLKKIQEFLEQTKVIHLNHQIQFESFAENLTSMWSKILFDGKKQAEFRESLKDISDSTLKRMKDEILRCQEVRRTMLEPLLKQHREKISKLWEELTFSEEERQDFGLFFCSQVTEEILQAHEEESQRLEAQLEKSRELIQLANKRFNMWTRRLQLEEGANDKNRFKNRGGQLLMEEKERKSIEVNLPKIEKKIFELAQIFEEEHKAPFKWHGKSLLEKMEEDHQDYDRQKEFKKQLRKVDQLHLPSPKRPESAPRSPRTPLSQLNIPAATSTPGK